MLKTPWVAALAVIAAECLPVVARAQSSGADIATAQALFDEGKRLMGAKKYEDACPKFEESERLDPGGGTMLAIALCHEAQGRTATAWGDFNNVLSEAYKSGRRDRGQVASDHIKALEPRLTRVRVVVETKSEGEELRRDGVVIGSAQWGTPVPIDPGEHVFEAAAKGKTTWKQSMPVRGEGSVVDVMVPKLEDAPIPEPAATPPPVVTAPPPAARATAPAAPPPASPPNDRMMWAGVAAGAGAVAMGVGAAFGFSAIARWNTAQNSCKNGFCAPGDGLSAATGAASAADISTVLFIVGGVAFAGAGLILLTAPKSGADHALRIAPAVGPNQAGLTLRGGL